VIVELFSVFKTKLGASKVRRERGIGKLLTSSLTFKIADKIVVNYRISSQFDFFNNI
jgi:hypothetical protein